MGRDLTNLFIDQSYQYLLQISGSEVQDGLGTPVDFLDVSASYALTASYAENVPAFDTGSLLVTASVSDATLTFTKGDTSTFDLTVNNVANAVSASHAVNADIVGLFNKDIPDGVNDQFLTTDGAGNLSFDWVKTLHQNIHNHSGVTIYRGTPLYISGSTGDNANVYLADASATNRRPATLIAYDASLAPNATGTGIISGEIQGVDTSAYPEGTIVYLGIGGGWTATRPTGSANLVQALGVVTRQSNNGRGIVFNQIGNNLPNIQRGYAWVGGVGDLPTPVATGSLSVAYATNALSASYAVSASHEIIKEISSSYADYAKEAGYATSSLSASYATTASYAINAGTWDGQYSGSAGITGSLTVIGTTEDALRVGTIGSLDYVTIAGPTSPPNTFDGSYIQGIGSFRDNNNFQYLTHPTTGGNTTLYATGSSSAKVASNVNGAEVLKVINEPGADRGIQVTGNTIQLQMTDTGSFGFFMDYFGSPTSRAQAIFSVGGYDAGGQWKTTTNFNFAQADQSFIAVDGDLFIKNNTNNTGSIQLWSENVLTLRGDTGVVIRGTDPNNISNEIDIQGKAFSYTTSTNINGFSITVDNLSTVRENQRAYVETPLQVGPSGTVVVEAGSTLKVINEL